MKVYSTTFLPDSVLLQSSLDIPSEWVRRVGRPGDMIESTRDVRNFGNVLRIIHELSEALA